MVIFETMQKWSAPFLKYFYYYIHCHNNLYKYTGKLMVNNTSELCGNFQLAVCQYKQDVYSTIWRLPEHSRTSGRSWKAVTLKAEWSIVGSPSSFNMLVDLATKKGWKGLFSFRAHKDGFGKASDIWNY